VRRMDLARSMMLFAAIVVLVILVKDCLLV